MSVNDLSQDYKPAIIKSPISEWTAFFKQLEQDLVFPVPSVPDTSSTPVSDACLLTCGCVVSEKIAREYILKKTDIPQHELQSASASINTNSSINLSIKTDTSSASSIHLHNLSPCPICQAPETDYLKPLVALRNVYKKLEEMKKYVGKRVLLDPPNSPKAPGSDKQPPDSVLSGSPDTFMFASDDQHTTNVDLSSILIDYSVDENNRLHSKQLLKTFMDTAASLPNAKLSLLDIFRSASSSVQKISYQDYENTQYRPNPQQAASATSNNTTLEGYNSSLHAALTPEELSTYRRMSESIGGIRLPPAVLQQREKYYSKCFPTYRKQFQHSVGSWFPLARSKSYVSTAISPDATKFVVLSEKKWSVYQIPRDFNNSPTLLFSGKSTGEVTRASNEKGPRRYASSSSMKNADSVQPDPNEIPQEYFNEGETEDLETWSMQIASMSNRYLVISGTNGIMRVYDLERNAKAVYHYKSKYFIRYMAVSPTGQFIACATTGLDKKSKTTNKRVPMVVLHWLRLGDFCPQMVYYHMSEFDKSKISPKLLTETSIRFEEAETINIEIPYNDEISILSFSADDGFISCATRETSHILIINITNPHQPRLCQRLSRRSSLDDEDSEGITCLQFHPGNQFLSVTSAAPKAYPMIITTDLQNTQVSPSSSFSGPSGQSGGNGFLETMSGIGSGSLSPSSPNQALQMTGPGGNNAPTIYSSQSSSTGNSKLKVLMRVEKVGSMIHKAAVSPRPLVRAGSGISVAYLDKNGLVYLMHSIDKSHRRIMVLTEVSSSPGYMSSASLRFSPTGHALFVLDRKGNFHIQDFAAGFPQQAGISKCRILG